jgi:iron complex outermembrane receptor protein
MPSKKVLLSITVATGALLASSAAYAAETGAEATSLSEIVVTAQKRSQTIQDIPAAVSALSGKALEQRGINDVQGLQFQTPSLQVGHFLGDTAIAVRGVGMNQTGPAVQSGVAVYADGVYQARSGLGGLSQLDLSRVEVLRGPQGTLYGRNASGGAVNFVANAPTDTFEGRALAGYANYQTLHVQGLLNAPLGGRVRTRLVVDYQDQGDGYVENVGAGPDVGYGHMLTGRLKMDVDLTPSATLALSLFGLKGAGPTDYLVLRSAPSALAIAANPYMAGMAPPLSPNRTSANTPSDSSRKAGGAAATLDWDFRGVKLKSITSYVDYKFTDSYDADGTQLSVFNASNFTKSQTLTQEFNLAGKTERLDWLLGAFYMDDDLSAHSGFIFPLGLNIPVLFSALTPGAFLGLTASPYKTQSYAAFADGTLSVTDQLNLMAGIRYSKEKQRVRQTSLTGPVSTPFGVFPVLPSCTDLETKAEFESVTPRAALQYEFSSKRNAYVSVSRGFKSGGVNASVCANTYRPEKITAYEGGLRTRLADDRVTFNVTGFYYDYTDFQVQQIQGLSAPIVNAPKATVKGLEVEGVWAPDRHWAFNANLSLLDATYGEFTNVDTLNPLAGSQSLKGNRLNRAPQTSGNIGAQYTTSPSDIGSFTARGDLYLTSSYYFREFNTAQDRQGGYGLLNVSVTWTSPSERYAVRAFAANATDTDYITSLGSSDNIGTRYITWGAPAQYGVELRATF